VIHSFPEGFRVEAIATSGATIHTRIGDEGPAVVMLHGYADTGDMWGEAAAALAGRHTVIVPELRGMGLSSQPASGYDKKIGNMVAYALRRSSASG